MKVNQHSRIRSFRMNTLLLYASGHTYSQTYQKALEFGVTSKTAESYMDQLVSYLAKHKSVLSTKDNNTISIN